MTNDPLTMIDEAVTLFAHPVPEAVEFEMRLAAWQAGAPLTWAELMVAWVELPTAPVSRVLVLRLIMGLIEK
jgi:hypothetical protein